MKPDNQLIAVLTAAVAAMLNAPAGSLTVKSYKRVPDRTPAWTKAGITDVMNSRL